MKPFKDAITVKPGDRLILHYDQCYYSDAEAEAYRGKLEAQLGIKCAALPMNITVQTVEEPSTGEGVPS